MGTPPAHFPSPSAPQPPPRPIPQPQRPLHCTSCPKPTPRPPPGNLIPIIAPAPSPNARECGSTCASNPTPLPKTAKLSDFRGTAFQAVEVGEQRRNGVRCGKATLP